MILSITLNPSVDHAEFIKTVSLHDTNRVLKTDRDAGGKGVNLSRMVVRLGGETVASGFLGGGAGAYVRRQLDSHGVPHRFVPIAGETRVNFSVEDESGLPPTTFNEAGPSITDQELECLYDTIADLLDDATWLALGGSMPPDLDPAVFVTLSDMAKARGVRVSLDADGPALKLGLAASPQFAKPNVHEAERLLGRPVQTLEQAISAAEDIRLRVLEAGKQEDPYPVVIVSRGAEGAVMAACGGVYKGYCPCREARSTVGCGDSMVAGVLWALDGGKTCQDAFKWGLAAGAATAASDGSDIGSAEDAKRLYEGAVVERVTP